MLIPGLANAIHGRLPDAADFEQTVGFVFDDLEGFEPKSLDDLRRPLFAPPAFVRAP